MAYQLKYFTQFVSIDNKLNRVELWQNTAIVLTPEGFTTENMPFSTELPDLDHKFQVARGTGCELNLLSDTDMRFFNGLYHVDKKEFIIKHFIDGAVNWLGYLNSEMMRESYSSSSNYPVQVTGNDGFALMDRIQFLTDAGAIFTGIKSKFELIQIIFAKIGLPFQKLIINLSTTFATFSNAANSTILHESFVDCANFYNEDGEAETLRTVLEGILKPYGARVYQKQGNIIIDDIHTLATGTSITYKRFALPYVISSGLSGTVETIINASPTTAQTDRINVTGIGGSATINFDTTSWVLDYSTFLLYRDSNPPYAITSNSNGTELRIGGGMIYVVGGTVNYAFPTATTITNLTAGDPIVQGDYIGDVVINPLKTISDIGYLGTDTEQEISGGKNKQVVSYSPYPFIKILEFSANDDFSSEGATIEYKPGFDFWWNELLYNNSNTWDKTNNGKFVKMFGVAGSNLDRIDNYLKIDKYGIGAGYAISGDTLSFKCKLNLPYIIPADYKLRINAKAFVRTIDTLGNESVDHTADMFLIEFFTRVKIGNKKYCFSPTYANTQMVKGWKDLTSADYYSMVFYKAPTGIVADMSAVDNEWIDLKYYFSDNYHNPIAKDYIIPLDSGFTGGQLEFEIYGFRVWPKWSDTMNTTKSDALMTKVKDVRLKDLTFTLIDGKGNEISNTDIEYIGYLNPLFKDEASKVDLICGTVGRISDRGKELFMDGLTPTPILTWTRANQTFKIEELLLNSLSSNYRAGYRTLNSMKLKNSFDQSSVLTDEPFLPGLKFMVKSATVNYRDNLIECSLVEILPDELTFVV